MALCYKYVYSIITACLLLLMAACTAPTAGTAVVTDFSKQSIAIDTTEPDSSFLNTDQAELRKEYIAICQQPVNADSFFTSNGTTYKVSFRHFCISDSILIVPALYNFDTGNPFSTHPFASELVITKENDTILYKKITAAFFTKLADESLKKYGTLVYPQFTISEDSIRLRYSYIIPVTDVGLGVGIVFNKDGGYKIEE